MDAINKCPNCGAAVEPNYDGSSKCAYCGGVFGEKRPVAIETSATIAPAAVPSYTFDLSAPAREYTRGQIFKKNIARGFLLWIIWSVFRAILPVIFGKNFDIESVYFNNIIISPIGGAFWFARAALFIIGYPLLICTVFYNKAKNG